MLRRWWRVAVTAALASVLVWCSDDMSLSAEGGGDGAGPGDGGGGGSGGTIGGCLADDDCPSGLVCRARACVSPDDGRPPEEEEDATFLRPVASERHVFALSPNADSAAVIDPVTLDIEAVILPDEPVAAVALPGADAAVVLSREGRALSVLSIDETGASHLAYTRTDRRFSALSVSPDGAIAVLWTPEGELPDAGAEGVVALVELGPLLAGEAPRPLERAAGRRLTDVLFRVSGDAALEVVVIGKEEVAILPLADLDGHPERVRLPDGYREIVTREAIGAPDGSFVLFRSFGAPELLALDVAARSTAALPLPAIATDLELTPNGSLAVAALRATGQVAIVPLPAGLADPALVTFLDASAVVPGQVELAPDGSRGVLFTSTESTEAFGVVELGATPSVRPLSILEKWVGTIGMSPDGTRAVVVHRPNPGSTVADLYERDVDVQHGYSVVDLEAGVAQLKLTGNVAPGEFVFAADGRHAAVTLRDDARRVYRVDAVDLGTLVTDSLELASAPEYAGALVNGEGDLADRIWVTQVHPAGRISFVDLAERAVRTATGYELNSDVD